VIRLENVELRRGIKVLFTRASAAISPGDRVGLIGANGAGKSSLFSMLRGELQPDAGDVSIPSQWRMAYVAQHDHAIAHSAVDQVLAGDESLRAIEERLALLHQDSSVDGLELAAVHQAYEEAGGYTARSRAEALLLGLGFRIDQIERPVDEFSGGWRMRIALARALMNPSDLLLLDEPTNHLDLDAIVWLEQWLKRYEGTLIVISHDREFLDSVCKTMLSIEDKSLVRYGGNYTAFEVQRAEQRRQSHFAWDKQQRDIAHLQSFIDRFKAKASKAKQAQSRVKALERMELLAPAHVDSPFSFRFAASDRCGDPMLKLESVACGYQGEHGPVTILGNVSCELRNGERLGLLGANGQGKSTLVKTLAGELTALAGVLERATNLKVGYFAQHQIESLRPDDTPLEHLVRIAPGVREQVLRNYLGRFDFGAEAAGAPIRPFSGGEKARLALALLIYTKPNLLLLDEPTNHLDLDTREALIRALAEYDGTMVLVSHDRALLRATVDRFWLIADGAVVPFDGDLDEYRDWLLNRDKSAPRTLAPGINAELAAPAAVKTQSALPKPARADRRDAARVRSEQAEKRKPHESRVKRIEAQLAKLNGEREHIKTKLADPDSYSSSRADEMRQMAQDDAYLAREIAKLEEEWLEQQSVLEQIGALS
jgi:ATP-binding cassette subfamily F protein 3